MKYKALPDNTEFEDLPVGAVWAVDPREPGVQVSGPYLVPITDSTLREELIQTAAVCVAIIEDLDEGAADVNGESASPFKTRTDRVLAHIAGERAAQDAKWGPQHHEIEKWLVILGEEYGESCKAALEEVIFKRDEE